MKVNPYYTGHIKFGLNSMFSSSQMEKPLSIWSLQLFTEGWPLFLTCYSDLWLVSSQHLFFPVHFLISPETILGSMALWKNLIYFQSQE